MNRSSLYGRG